MKLSARNQLLLALRHKAIVRSEDDASSASGPEGGAWRIEIGRVLTDPRLLSAAAELFWQNFGAFGPFQVGAAAAFAPLLTAIQLEALSGGRTVAGFIVREESRSSATGDMIEGELTDDPVVLIEALLSSAA